MSTVVPVHAGTLRRITAGMPFFAPWSASRFRAMERASRLITADDGETVLAREALDPFAYFLLDGEVSLQSDRDARVLRKGDLDAGYPLAHLRPSRYRVTARSRTTLLRIERAPLQKTSAAKARFALREESTGTWREHPFVADFVAGLDAGRVELPTMPAIALKIRRAVADERFGVADLATIVSADPAIAFGLIKVANSALFRGDSPFDSVRSAIGRIGVTRTQNLVTSLALRGLFAAEQPHIATRLKQVWQHSVEIAALTAVLARLSPPLAADVALMVGLLHEIGTIPLLKAAADYLDLEDTPGILDEILTNLGPVVSGRILSEWAFAPAFADAANHSRDWFHESETSATYCDLTIVAHLHALVRRREFERLPRIDETPAFGKLALGQLSPQLSLLVLEESKAHIRELRALLA